MADPDEPRAGPAGLPDGFLAYGGLAHFVRQALMPEADVNAIEPETGMSALHITVGMNDLALTRKLVETGKVLFFADAFGRMPSVVAIECDVDDELADYITEVEADFVEQKGS